MTTRTITAMFDKYVDAKQAVTRLEAAGVPHSEISIVSNDTEHKQYHDTHGSEDHPGLGTGASLGTLLGGGAGLLAGLGLLAIPGLGPVVAAGWLASTLVGAGVGAGVGAAAGGLTESLTHAGVDEADAHAYAEGVSRGGTLVTGRADDTMTKKVADILDDHGTVNMDEREAGWRKEGWNGTYTGGTAAGAATGGVAAAVGNAARNVKDAVTGGTTTTGTGATTGYNASTATRTAGRTDEAIPVIQEKLSVGKREENRGRVRIHTHMVETPVQEQVTLSSETVTLDRHAVDRALTGTDSTMFRDRTIEATEHTEVPVVAKEARVVEEIGLRKDATQRTETVSDKVRHTEVEVEDERGQVTRSTGPATTARPVR